MNFLTGLVRRKIVVGAVIIVVVGGGYYIYKKSKTTTAAPQYVTAAVEKGTLTVSVSGTGQVSSSNQVDLKPSGSGKITSVRVKAGQEVKAGDVIATLDTQSAANQIKQAQVAVMQAQAAYDKLIAGATDSDLLSSRLSVESAQQALDKAKSDLEYTKQEQQRAVDKAQNTLLNSGLEPVQSDTVTTADVTLSGTYTGTAEGRYVVSLYQTGAGIYYQINGLGSGNGPVTRGVPFSLGNGLYLIISSSGTLDVTTRWTVDVPNKTSASYWTNQTAYQAALLAQTKAVQQAQDAITTAENNVKKVQNDLDAKLEPATNTDIASAKVQIESAKLQLAIAQTAYAQNILTAPFAGIVASVSARLGDQASSGAALATVITKEKIAEITLNEVDVAKIKVGQKAVLSFDAVDGLSVAGEVREVGIIGTATQGVVSYTVKIGFDSSDDRIKPGMSVSASIITDVKQDVLLVPSSAVKASGNESYVQTLENGQPVQHAVTAGLSNDSQTEISGDITQGDLVVTQTITATAQQTTSQTGSGQRNPAVPGLGGFGGGGVRVFQGR